MILCHDALCRSHEVSHDKYMPAHLHVDDPKVIERPKIIGVNLKRVLKTANRFLALSLVERMNRTLIGLLRFKWHLSVEFGEVHQLRRRCRPRTKLLQVNRNVIHTVLFEGNRCGIETSPEFDG